MEHIARKPTAANVAEHIEKLILEGTLRAGERLLSERHLAESLGVSRPTVRDGVQLLCRRGILISEAGGRTEVAQIGDQLLDPIVKLLESNSNTSYDYLEFRKSIDGSAAALAAQRATDLDLAAISDCMSRITAAHALRDTIEEADADADLHIAIYEATHNAVILHIMRAFSRLLRTGTFYSRETLYSHGDVRDVLYEQHRAICDAILTRNSDGARAAAERHINFTHQSIIDIRAAESRRGVSMRRRSNVRLSSPIES